MSNTDEQKASYCSCVGCGAVAERAHMAVVAAWSLFLAILFLLAIRAFVKVPGFDSSVFLYIAEGLFEGELPYVDRWDHKPPLIFLINAVGLLLSDVWGILIIQAGFLLATCLAAYKLLKPSFGLVATLFATTVLLVYFTRLVEGGNLTEQYALPLQFGALALFVAAEEGGKPKKLALMALGVLGGAALMLRPNLIGAWLAIGLYWLAYRNNVALKFGWAAVGGMTIVLGLLAWLAFAGGIAALAAFWDAAIVYNLHYSDASFRHKLSAVRQGFALLHPVAWLLVLGWAIGVWQTLTTPPDRSRFAPLVRVAVLLLPIELAATGITGYRFWHYYMALLPVVCVLSAFAVGQILDSFTERLPWLPIALFAASASVWTMGLQGLQAGRTAQVDENVQAERFFRDPAALGGQRSLVEQIKQLSGAGDSILIWGGSALPHLAADRRAPTRHFSPLWLTRGNKREERIEEFTADVIASPPMLIVDMRSTYLPPLETTGSAHRRWRPKRRGQHYDYRSFRAFLEFVDSNYTLVDTAGSRDIYRKINH